MLDDRYRIDELLSVGGMGAVYAGSRAFAGRRAAGAGALPGPGR